MKKEPKVVAEDAHTRVVVQYVDGHPRVTVESSGGRDAMGTKTWAERRGDGGTPAVRLLVHKIECLQAQVEALREQLRAGGVVPLAEDLSIGALS